MKSAIVTGAGGFVGKAVVQELLNRGVEVWAITRPQSKHPIDLERVHIIECNLSDYANLANIIALPVDVFFHFAWEGTSGSMRADEGIQLANVQGSCNAMNSAASLGCKRFIYASSIMQYEVEAVVKSMENPGPNSMYSVCKMTADYMLRIIASKNNIEYNSALISNIYGPGEHSPRLINSTIRKALQGEHLAFSPGEQLYDFIYITDAAKMFAEIGERGIAGRTYYIGNKDPKPLKGFLYEMQTVLGCKDRFGIGELPFNGISLNYTEFSTKLLYDELGYKPSVSFAEGIEKTKDWILQEAEQ